MKVVAFNGSPRKEAIRISVLVWYSKSFKRKDRDRDCAARQRKYQGLQACFKCSKKGQALCSER